MAKEQPQPFTFMGYAFRSGAYLHIYRNRKTGRTVVTNTAIGMLAWYKVWKIRKQDPDNFLWGMYLDPEDLAKHLVLSCASTEEVIARGRKKGWIVDFTRRQLPDDSDRPLLREDPMGFKEANTPTRWGRVFHGLPVCTHPFYSGHPGAYALDSALREGRQKGLEGDALNRFLELQTCGLPRTLSELNGHFAAHREAELLEAVAQA